MKKIKYSLLTGALALSVVAGAVLITNSKKSTTAVYADSTSSLASRQVVWSTDTSDTNFKWSAPLRTVNDFNIGWVGLSTQYYISNFTWTYKNNEQNIVDSMSFTKMYFDTNSTSASLSVTVSTIVDGEVKKTQSIPVTHLSDPYPKTHWLCDDVVKVTGLASLVGNKQVTFKFEATGTTTRFGFVKEQYFTVSGYPSTKVRLDNQGGSTDSSVYLVEGYPMPNVSVPTREDYEFDGYYTEVEGGGTKYYNADGTPALTSAGSATALYAKWNRVGTNITLEKEGGTGGDDSALGVLGEVLADVIVPTRPGYTFNGYYSEPNGHGTQYYDEDGQSSFVWNSEATSATFYASWTIKPEVQNAITKIDQIGTVTYSEDSLAKLNDAQSAYDAVEASDKAGVSNYSTLEEGWNTYNAQKQAGVDTVKGLIDAIGEVVYPDSGTKITAARTAYDALTAEQKTLVGEEYLSKLVVAEATYKSLDDNYKADQVDALITAIGTVEDTQACKDKIDAARNAYNALTADQKALVENYAILEAAEKAYNDLHSVSTAKALINAIGEVTYTDECKAKIDAARAAYDALTAEQKASIENYTTLTNAEEVYKHVDDVAKAIDNIGNVTLDSGDDIKTATEAYNALTEEEKALISNYHDTLEEKTQIYEKLVSQHKTSVTLAIVFGIIGGLILIVCGAWALMMFVFNKWTKVGDKALRAFKLFGLKNKDGKFLVLVFPMKFVRKEDAELFNNKEDALK